MLQAQAFSEELFEDERSHLNHPNDVNYKLKCGEILLMQHEWKILFRCAVCSLEMQQLEVFLNHSLEHHLILDDEDDVTALVADTETEDSVDSLKQETGEEYPAGTGINSENLEDDNEKENGVDFNEIPFDDEDSHCVQTFDDNSTITATTMETDHSYQQSLSIDSGSFAGDEDVDSLVVGVEIELLHTKRENYDRIEARLEECPQQTGSENDLDAEPNRAPSAIPTGAFVCELCKKTFRNRYKLHMHLRRHTEIKAFECDICGAKFMDSSNFRVHHNRHLGIKPHGCNDCGSRFASTSELKLHRRRHTGERPFGCPDCGRTYRTAAHLSEHRKRHTNDRRFICATCGKRFYDNKLLRDHEISHSADRPYSCALCQLTFARRKALVEHMKLHSDVKQHRCPICSLEFAQNAGLHIHMKKHHTN